MLSAFPLGMLSRWRYPAAELAKGLISDPEPNVVSWL